MPFFSALFFIVLFDGSNNQLYMRVPLLDALKWDDAVLAKSMKVNECIYPLIKADTLMRNM